MKERSIIFFDGVCNLCNYAVQFVIKHDRKNQFLFASLQSETAKKMLESFSVNANESDTFILVENGKMYKRSTGALRVLRRLSGFWRLLYCFIIVPKFIRDGVYNIIAKKRYKWFGRKDECMVPTPELSEKFLN